MNRADTGLSIGLLQDSRFHHTGKSIKQPAGKNHFIRTMDNNQEHLPSGDAAVELDDSASNKRKRDSDSDDDEEESRFGLHAEDEGDNEPDGHYNDHRGEEGEDEQDDDVEEEEDDEEDENGNFLILGGSDDDDDDNDGDDNDDDDEDDQKEEFCKTCLRIARNDPTMLDATEWSMDRYGNRQGWSDYDLFLLGNSLVGNTHLKSLTIENSSFFANVDPRCGVTALCHGIANSQINSLLVTSMSFPLQILLFHAIKDMASLRRLAVSETRMHNNSSLWVTPNRFLEEVSLTNCEISDSTLQTLSQGLFTITPCLSMLDLSSNEISDVGVGFFCQCWNDDLPLRNLNLATNRITSIGATQLLQASTRQAAFRSLDISCNIKIGHDGLEQIGRELPNIGFTDLEVHDCVKPLAWPRDSYEQAAKEAACSSLADGLRHNTSLVTLDIGGNCLGAVGAQMVMQAIAAHPTLEVLHLASDGSVGLLGIKLIGMELAHTNLKEIVLHDLIAFHWPIPQTPAALAAGQALLDGVRRNGTLTEFRLWELPIAWDAPIQFYVNWNALCRPLLRSDVVVPAVWPHVLDFFQREDDFSEMYMIFREQPWLVVSTTATTTITPKACMEIHQPLKMAWESIAGLARRLPELLASTCWNHMLPGRVQACRKKQKTESSTTESTWQQNDTSYLH